MLGALRLVTVQRGLDPREFGLVAFGGAGPMHANAMAAVLGCFPVIVPPNPGVFSALGFVQSEFKNEFSRTMIKSTVGLASDELWDEFAELERRAIAWLDEEGVTESDRNMRFSADLRYEQQGFEVTVDVPKEAVESDDLDSVLQQYHELHERLYGVRFDVPVELVVLRVVATGAMPPVIESAPADTAVENLADAVIEHHPTYFHGTWVDTPNYDRDRLGHGLTIEGPAVIRQYDATTLILPDHWAEVDEFGNLLIRPSGHATNGHDAKGHDGKGQGR